MKHLYSIFKKMTRDEKDLEEIFDIFAVRVIVNTVSECYHALGIIHSMYTPIIMRIKDFIATPKFNMYQSLHTTVMGKNGKMVEVQIRTKEMHQTAETGIAAHWRYKEGKVKPDEIDSFVVWLRKAVDWQKGTPEANEFMHELKMDLFQDEIFVFTPKGDLIQLPQGSTPVDFAFSLHSEIGLHCGGAKVNGRIAPLDIELKSGQWVDILTNPNKTPNPRWLDSVKTARARSVLRRWMKKQRYDESKELGLNIITKIEKQRGEKISETEREKLIEKFHQKNWEQFIVSLGGGDVSFHSVQHFFGLTPKPRKSKDIQGAKKEIGVSIHGLGNLLVKYAKCCRPLPGDIIIGYITRGKGLMSHRADCEIIRKYPDEERIVDVSWDPREDMFFVASLRVQATDRKGLLTDITSAISKTNSDIRSAKAIVKDGLAIDDFEVDVKNLEDLKALMKNIRNVKGVSKVERLDKRLKENSNPSYE
jgi:GTP pyrophosphokinase